MRYLDFLNLKYVPKDTDLICEFHVEPEGISLEEAAGGVAAESSVGTWTEITTKRLMSGSSPRRFSASGATL